MGRLLPRSAWTHTAASSPGLLEDPVGLAVHWLGPAAPPAVNRGDREATARFLEAIRRFHVSTNGWSDIAYQQAVDQAGRRWVLRGWGRRSAANGDTVPNARFGAVVALIGQGQEATEELLEGLWQARQDFRDRHPTGRRLVTHNDIRPEPTACPGPQLTRWVKAGGPRPAAPPAPPPITPDTEEDAMTIVVAPNGSRYHLTSKGLLWLPKEVQVEGPVTEVHTTDETWQRYGDNFPRLKPDAS